MRIPFKMESSAVLQYRYLIAASISCACTIAMYYLVEVKAKKLGQQIKDRGTRYDGITLLCFVLGRKARSNLYAVVTFPLAVYSLLYGEDMYNFVRWNSEIATLSCSVSLGYMLGDLIIDVVYWSEMGEIQYLLHHLNIIFGCIIILSSGCLKMFGMVRSLCEGSNLFVNSRNVLNHAGLQRTLPYYYTSVAMVISFFVFRILPIPVLLYMLISAMGTDDYRRQNIFVQALPILCHAVLDVLNSIWFYKIVRSVKRMLRAGGNRHNDQEHSAKKTKQEQVY